MDWIYWKQLLIRAGWAAIYGALADLAITQNMDWHTLVVALSVAGIRALIIFLTTIKESLETGRTTAKSFGFGTKSTWKKYI